MEAFTLAFADAVDHVGPGPGAGGVAIEAVLGGDEVGDVGCEVAMRAFKEACDRFHLIRRGCQVKIRSGKRHGETFLGTRLYQRKLANFAPVDT